MSDSTGKSSIWSGATLQELYHTHPNWEVWAPKSIDPTIVSIRSKLREGNHGDLKKCTVDPIEARDLSTAQGIPLESGFWLIPPLRAPADVRLFNCTERCAEAGTTILIPEHKVGYPAVKGSVVLVKKGVAYGVGVLRSEVFDQHCKEGKPCCKNLLVVLRSTKREISHISTNSLKPVNQWIKSNNGKHLDRLHTAMGPAALMKALKGVGTVSKQPPLNKPPSQSNIKEAII
jgi:hypothetical protein